MESLSELYTTFNIIIWSYYDHVKYLNKKSCMILYYGITISLWRGHHKCFFNLKAKKKGTGQRLWLFHSLVSNHTIYWYTQSAIFELHFKLDSLYLVLLHVFHQNSLFRVFFSTKLLAEEAQIFLFFLADFFWWTAIDMEQMMFAISYFQNL